MTLPRLYAFSRVTSAKATPAPDSPEAQEELAKLLGKIPMQRKLRPA